MKTQDKILDFFDKNKRDLPWRIQPTPYKTLISEIMLQQTRVETVIPYFNRFISEISDIISLSKIDDERLYKLWQGLGYYNRAKNLKKAALQIVESHEGAIPSTYEDLLSLPGIGPYTAGAIGSIAFGLDCVAIDGNVLRVFSRCFGIREDIKSAKVKERVKAELRLLYPLERIGDFTEALMEIGATICLPIGKPNCEYCPLKDECFAFKNNLTDSIPSKSKAAKRSIEKLTVLTVCHNRRVWIRKRPESGLLSSLWELPNQEGHLTEGQIRKWMKEMGMKPLSIKENNPSKHFFTHKEWHMRHYHVSIEAIPTDLEESFVHIEKITEQYSIPTAFQRFLKEFE